MKIIKLFILLFFTIDLYSQNLANPNDSIFFEDKKSFKFEGGSGELDARYSTSSPCLSDCKRPHQSVHRSFDMEACLLAGWLARQTSQNRGQEGGGLYIGKYSSIPWRYFKHIPRPSTQSLEAYKK